MLLMCLICHDLEPLCAYKNTLYGGFTCLLFHVLGKKCIWWLYMLTFWGQNMEAICAYSAYLPNSLGRRASMCLIFHVLIKKST